MVNFSKRYINIVSLIITIVIYFTWNCLFFNRQQNNIKFTSILNLLKRNNVQVEIGSSNITKETKENIQIQKNESNLYIENIQNINIQNNNIKNNEIITPNNTKEKTRWKVIIPAISLEADISEGTGKEVMDEFVGHFEETAKINGNIGLASHNRGYKVNYFSNLKKVKEDDEIIYQYQDYKKTYVVTKNVVIKDIDWSYLQNTKENKITLITCIENEPNYRRCVQGIEKK